jgi:2,5-dioxopentanoate dehydrogenase
MSEISTLVHETMVKSNQAWLEFRKYTYSDRAKLLDTIALEIENLGDELIQTASIETNLPEARFVGERGRTIGQLKSFSQLLREGSWVGAIIETALPDRKPIAKPDMRKMDIPIGPIVVFGASNFPLAYSTAGGDTASALAAGCPVVVKGHPSHPKTSRLVSKAIHNALAICRMNSNIFQHIEGEGFDIGKELVQHPLTAGIGFTGSLSGGRAIFDYGNQRSNPIPVFAEMGSTNPVILMPEKLHAENQTIAQAFASSITMGVGQFCTNPGIIIGIKGPDLDQFEQSLAEAISRIPCFQMLHPGIYHSYTQKLEQTIQTKGVKCLYKADNQGEIYATAAIFSVDSSVFAQNPTLHHEIFGPASIVIHCEDMVDMATTWQLLHGQLTTTLMGTETELLKWATLTDIASHLSGRIVFNNVPTGVDVNAATVHGGPYPSSTDGRFSSVGTEAIKRWVRPVCFQDCPDPLLPLPLQNSNPMGIFRKINGDFTRNSVNV